MQYNNTRLFAIPVALLLLQGGCVSGTRLTSQSIAALDMDRGSYNLILYGGQNYRDLASVAILDRTDDAYTILPYGATFKYHIIENLSADKAVERGSLLINDLHTYKSTETRAIYGPNNTIIGYELRPLFWPLDTGHFGDIVNTSYVLQAENQVTVYVGFKGNIQDPLDSHGGDFDNGVRR
jgi:hypothetical protein